MRLSISHPLYALPLAVGVLTPACGSNENKPTATSATTSTSDSSSATTSPSTSTSAGGGTSTTTMASSSSMGTMGGTSSAVTNDAVTVDSTSSTTSTSSTSSTADSTSSSTSGGGSSSSGGAGGASNSGAGGTSSTAEFTFSTPAFDNLEGCTCEARDSCDSFPQENTNFGDNTSPEFDWTAGPEGTQFYAIVMQDIANGYVHWAIWNIPGTVTMLAAGLPSDATLSDPAGAQQVTNFNQMGYFGPGACNVYEFTLYALSDSFTPSSNTVDSVKQGLDEAGALATLTLRARADDSYCSGGGTCM